MGIFYDEKQQVFHLTAGTASYVMQVACEQYLTHLYWGRRVNEWHPGNRAVLYIDRQFEHGPDFADRTFSLGTLPQEYPQYGKAGFPKRVLPLQENLTGGNHGREEKTKISCHFREADGTGGGKEKYPGSSPLCYQIANRAGR